jgi:hypothetical protein
LDFLAHKALNRIANGTHSVIRSFVVLEKGAYTMESSPVELSAWRSQPGPPPASPAHDAPPLDALVALFPGVGPSGAICDVYALRSPRRGSYR